MDKQRDNDILRKKLHRRTLTPDFVGRSRLPAFRERHRQLLLFGLWATSFYSYLLFHGIAGLFSIVVACGIFVLVTAHVCTIGALAREDLATG